MIHPTTDNCPASTWLRDIGPILYIYTCWVRISRNYWNLMAIPIKQQTNRQWVWVLQMGQVILGLVISP